MVKHVSNVSKKSYPFIFDIFFIVIGCICLLLYDQYDYYYYIRPLGPVWLSVSIAASIIIIYLYPMKVKEDKHIYKNKKCIIPFLIIIVFDQIMIYTLNKVWGINNYTTASFNRSYILLLQLAISSTLFIIYFFKIKFKDFNWDISLKSFILVILVYITFKLISSIDLIYNGKICFSNIFNVKFMCNFIIKTIQESIYPGIFEEVTMALLISGLKGFGFSDNKCNILYAIIFGIGHVGSWGTASWIRLLSTACQAMWGYLDVKLYFKTKSLVPCIILHGLTDAI
jgi:hypothetical protein